MRNTLILFALSFTLVGCEDTYRYPCQDPANKDNPECNRPACEADGFCYDTLNGLPPKQVIELKVEEVPAEPVVEQTAEETNIDESTGE